jgi:predicted nucleotidyltransferase
MKDPRLPTEKLLVHESGVIDIARAHKAVNLRVFESKARGEDRLDSDVDLLVHWEDGASLSDMLDLIWELESLLGCRVDIVSDDQLEGHFGHNVLTDAVRLESDSG